MALFPLSDTQRRLQTEARTFAQEVIRPAARRLDESEVFPWPWFRRCGELGLTGVSFPVKYGGQGMGELEAVLVLEELSRESGAMGLLTTAHMMQACNILREGGTEEQKQSVLRPALKGETLLGFALTEETGGSDALGLHTVARRDGEGWIINGSKRWISNAGEAQAYAVAAITDPARSRRGISIFLVEEGTHGLVCDRPERKMGMNNSPAGSLQLTDCYVPKSSLVGEENGGYPLVQTALKGGRLGISAVSVGMAQGAMDRALEYARHREQFGRPITSYQGISFLLAEMYADIYVARTMLHHVAYKRDCGGDISVDLAALKLFASEMCCKVCDKAIQILGGNGYSRDYEVERYARDARMLTIGEGTSQVCKVIIGNHLIFDQKKE